MTMALPPQPQPPGQRWILDPALVDRVARWLESGGGGMAWLTGWPGSGMTSMVTELTRGMEVVWVTSATPNDQRSRAFMAAVLSNRLAVTLRPKVLVVDEMESMLANEIFMADFASVLKQRFPAPIVCVLKSSRQTRTCETRKKAALTVDFPRPSPEATAAAVLRALGPGVDEAEVRRVCAAAPGDVRHALQTLRAESADTRDVGAETADAVRDLFADVDTVAGAARLYLADPGALASATFECYTQAAATVAQAAAFAEFASASDAVDEYMHARGDWARLMDVHGCMLAGAAAVVLPRAPGVALTTYGRQWNKNNARLIKHKLLRHVGLVRAERGMAARLGTPDLAWVQAMLGPPPRDLAAVADTCRRAGMDAQGFATVVRLGRGGTVSGNELARVRAALACHR